MANILSEGGAGGPTEGSACRYTDSVPTRGVRCVAIQTAAAERRECKIDPKNPRQYTRQKFVENPFNLQNEYTGTILKNIYITSSPQPTFNSMKPIQNPQQRHKYSEALRMPKQRKNCWCAEKS